MKIDEFENQAGHEIGLSRWLCIDQSRISAFAEITEDRQAVHLSPAIAAQASFGGTIAHGFLILSMLSVMLTEVMPAFEDRAISMNYGFDRIRFLHPVLAGSYIRGRFVLDESRPRASGDRVNRLIASVEIQYMARPALIAEWLVLERQRADVR
ncbi:MAG TPA: MaoC family dehydratase [Steroidobacteraceae bacterium]